MPIQVDHEQRRRELAEAAWRLIRRSGINALSVRAVGEEGGWTSGIVQHYFPTKNDLLRHTFQQLTERAADRMKLTESAPPMEALEAAVLALVPLDADRAAVAEVWLAFLGLTLGDASLRAIARDGATELIQMLAVRVRRAQEAGALRADLDADDIASELFILTDGLNVQALYTRPRLEPDVVSALVHRRLSELAA